MNGRIKLVKQEEPYGCGIATIATIIGRTYKDVAESFVQNFTDEKSFVAVDKLAEYVSYYGFSCVKKGSLYIGNIDRQNLEMLKPFAPIHAVIYSPYPDCDHGHAMIMGEDGKIFEPQKYEGYRDGREFILKRSVYSIDMILGFWKD